MKLFARSSWPGLFWSMLTFYLLSMDTQSMGEVSIMKLYGIDKLIHFFLFAMFAFLWTVRMINKPVGHENTILLLVIILGSAYGMGMEYYQKFFTSRSFSYWDGLADTLGSVAGAWAAKKSPYGNRGRNQN